MAKLLTTLSSVVIGEIRVQHVIATTILINIPCASPLQLSLECCVSIKWTLPKPMQAAASGCPPQWGSTGYTQSKAPKGSSGLIEYPNLPFQTFLTHRPPSWRRVDSLPYISYC